MNSPQWKRHVQRFKLLIMIALFASAPPAWAAPGDSPTEDSDAESAAAPDSAETRSSDASRLLERLTGDVIYLKNASGQLVPVPRDATLEEYLQWRNSRRRAAQADQPDFSITSLSLEGRADDQHARLTAKIRIRVFPEETWVGVPLALNEAVLLETAHEGDGSSLFDHTQFGPGSGHRWLIKGRGLHTLTLSFVVPVQKRVASRQLQLGLPPTAVSSLTLRVPLQPVSVKMSKQANPPAVTTQSAGASATEIRAHGLGRRLSLQWQPVPEERPVKAVLESTTLVTVTLPGDSVVLEAQQQVAALQGRFEQVSVRLPSGFELLDATPAVSHRDERNPDRVVVKLPEPTRGPVDLTWRLKLERPGRTGRLVVQGFDVERARRQTGRIAVQTVDGVQFVRQRSECKAVHRINISELPDVGEIATAYQFFSQPFRLVLGVEEIEPYTTAEPSVFLLFSSGEVQLDAVFRYQVFRGSVREIELRWPNFRAQGWELRPLQLPGLVEDMTLKRRDGETRLRVQLVQRQDESFELPLTAVRSVPSGSTGPRPLTITLPEAVASHALPGVLVAAKSVDVESLLSPQEGTSMRPLSAEQLAALELPEDWRGLARSGFRIESPAPSFSARVTVHDREIKTETALSAQVRRDHLLLEQSLLYDIAYERLSELRVVVPERLVNRVRFATEAGLELPGARTGLIDGSAEQVRITLPEPQLGQVAIKARFAVPFPETLRDGGEADVALNIPVIRSADAAFSSVRLAVPAEHGVDVSVEDSDWKREVTLDNQLVWTSDGPRSRIPLTLAASPGRSARQYAVPKALIRTAIDHSGRVRSRVQFRLHAPPATLMLDFPPQLTADGFWWDRTRLNGDQIEQRPGEPVRYRLTPPPEARDGDHLLTVDCHVETGAYGWSGRHEFVVPQLAGNVWIEQTVWSIILPRDQHLLTDPEGFTRQFHWSRETLLWSRRPDRAFRDLGAWISADQGPSEPSSFSQGTSYPFSRFGPVGSIRFRSMSRSLVVLIGAGLALAVGFLFLQVQAARTMLTLLAIGFALALASLWYPGPVQVLLQPALLGLLLAVAATMVDRFLRRGRSHPVLALPPASDYSPPSRPSSVARSVPSGEDAPEPATQRPSSRISESSGNR